MRTSVLCMVKEGREREEEFKASCDFDPLLLPFRAEPAGSFWSGGIPGERNQVRGARGRGDQGASRMQEGDGAANREMEEPGGQEVGVGPNMQSAIPSPR